MGMDKGAKTEGREIVEMEETRERRHKFPISEKNGEFTKREIDCLNQH